MSTLFTPRFPQAPANETGTGGTTTSTEGGAGKDAGATGAAANKSEAAGKGDVSILEVKDQKAADGKAAAGGAKDEDKGKADEKSADTKSKDDAELEVKLPDGAKVDEAMLKGFKAVAKEVGLDSEKASKLAGWYAQELSKFEKAEGEQRVKEWTAQNKEWIEDLKKDPDFGGKKFDATVAQAQSALARFGGEALSKELKKFGFDNHPLLVRAFARIGAAIAEDTSAAKGSSTGKERLSSQERISRFYEGAKQ